jgi:hypothetical protein
MILFSSLLFACSDEEEPVAEPAEQVVDSAEEEVEDTSADSGEAAE